MTRADLPRVSSATSGFFLRHERRTGGVSVGDLDEIKLGADPENHVLGEPAQMHSQQRGVGAKFDHEIAVAHAVHGILRELRAAFRVHEAKLFRDGLTVEWERAAGQRAAAERADVHARKTIREPGVVAFQHLDVGEEMVREINRLGALEMRVAGDDDGEIFRAEGDERFLQRANFLGEQGDLVAQPEADVERDLVVARAAGVELRAGGNALRQFRLEVHVDVLEFRLPPEFSGGDFLADLFEAGADGLQFRRGEHADLGEHGGVRDGADEIVFPEPPVEGNGLGKLGDIGGGTAGEPAGTGDWRGFFMRSNHVESAAARGESHV